MKLRTISNTMNIRNSVEFLTNYILAGNTDGIVLETEMGNIAVEIVRVRFHDCHHSNFGISVCKLTEAPFTDFVKDLIRYSKKDENVRLYVSIPYVTGQSKGFTKELVTRAMVQAFMVEAITDSGTYGITLSDTIIDAAVLIYNSTVAVGSRYPYTYNDFSRELCKLSVSPLRRPSKGFQDLLLANDEILRIRRREAESLKYSTSFDFRDNYDNDEKMTFGGKFYQKIFALLVEGANVTFLHTNPLELYNLATSRKYGQNKLILPITLMKVCLLDRPLKDEEGDK